VKEVANMKKENKIYITATELSEMLGVSPGHAYKIIRRLNKELEKDGYIVISGKVPQKYFEKRWYGYGA
jgi:Mn-dependent DtxR family transcriptional regulator